MKTEIFILDKSIIKKMSKEVGTTLMEFVEKNMLNNKIKNGIVLGGYVGMMSIRFIEFFKEQFGLDPLIGFHTVIIDYFDRMGIEIKKEKSNKNENTFVPGNYSIN